MNNEVANVAKANQVMRRESAANQGAFLSVDVPRKVAAVMAFISIPLKNGVTQTGTGGTDGNDGNGVQHRDSSLSRSPSLPRSATP
jgi:hypothetical protein